MQRLLNLSRNLSTQNKFRWISSSTTSKKKKRHVFMWGNGDYGRLGLGNLDSRNVPTVCEAFMEEDPCSISCGGAHTLFLTEKGRVLATGMNDSGQLGLPISTKHTVEPFEVCGFSEKVVQIAAGHRHSAAITEQGALYLWGDNTNGQLGLGKKADNFVATPTLVDSLEGVLVRRVALGSEHSMVITDGGDLLTWGAGSFGKLGHGHQSSLFSFMRSSSEYSPRQIKALEGVKITTIAAGLSNSACIDEHGCLFIFGEKKPDNLSFSRGKGDTSPSIVTELPSSVQVSCGGYHTCIISGDGELYTWGTNENGCLGLGYMNLTRTPELIEGLSMQFHVSEVSCGWKHTAAISGGQVFTWGWGGSYGTFAESAHSSGGQLGHGNEFDYFRPTMVDLGRNVNALLVSCGFNHTGAVLEYM